MTTQRRTYAISTVLPAVLIILVVCAVAPVLVVTYFVNSSNANALLSDRAELMVDGLEAQLRGLLDPVAEQLEVARDYIEQNDLWLEEGAQLETYIEGFISGTAQVSGIGIIRTDGSMRRWEEGKSRAIEEPSSALPLVQGILEQVRESSATSWSEPFVSLVLGDTILNPRIPLRKDGQFVGVLAAGVAGKRLSQYVSGLTQREVTAFILYNRDRIIAYPNQSANDDVPTSTELPTLEDSGLTHHSSDMDQSEPAESDK